MQTVSRRAVILATASVAGLAALPLPAQTLPPVAVVKDPACPCCGNWVTYLQAAGFDVTVETMSADDLARFKTERGVPDALVSCHTAAVAGYVLEGHVPADDIKRLLKDAPAAAGLSVPGMVMGSPGMGPEDQRDAYDVMIFTADGSAKVFSSYPAA